jgi:hypothetical protein
LPARAPAGGCRCPDRVAGGVAAGEPVWDFCSARTRLHDLFMGGLGQLRYEPIEKRIRGILAGHTVVDSHRAALVWEPKRVVPSYCIPVEDIAADLGTSDDQSSGAGSGLTVPRLGDRPVYDPSIPFFVHTASGESLDIRAHGVDAASPVLRPSGRRQRRGSQGELDHESVCLQGAGFILVDGR